MIQPHTLRRSKSSAILNAPLRSVAMTPKFCWVNTGTARRYTALSEGERTLLQPPLADGAGGWRARERIACVPRQRRAGQVEYREYVEGPRRSWC
eukprot:207635-Prorocentrum_minimum.AAC.4